MPFVQITVTSTFARGVAARSTITAPKDRMLIAQAKQERLVVEDQEAQGQLR